MGLADSMEKEDNTEGNTTSKDGEIPATILPLNKAVRVHLVPKFYTSEERGFTRSYSLVLTLRKNMDFYDARVRTNQYLTACAEFHERRQSIAAAETSIFLRDSFGRPRSRSVIQVNSLNDQDIVIKEVTLKEHESLRISGVFKQNLERIEDLSTCDGFDLILCPSFQISCHPGQWILLGTLFTKHANYKHLRHWRAAVRDNFS